MRKTKGLSHAELNFISYRKLILTGSTSAHKVFSKTEQRMLSKFIKSKLKESNFLKCKSFLGGQQLIHIQRINFNHSPTISFRSLFVQVLMFVPPATLVRLLFWWICICLLCRYISPESTTPIHIPTAMKKDIVELICDASGLVPATCFDNAQVQKESSSFQQKKWSNV